MIDNTLPKPEFYGYDAIMNDIVKAISELPIAEQLDIRNMPLPDEHAVFAGKDNFPVYKVSDMGAWRDKEAFPFIPILMRMEICFLLHI